MRPRAPARAAGAARARGSDIGAPRRRARGGSLVAPGAAVKFANMMAETTSAASDGAAGSLRRWQVLSSVVYYAVVWFLGMQSGIVGPTLGGIAALLGEESGTATSRARL